MLDQSDTRKDSKASGAATMKKGPLRAYDKKPAAPMSAFPFSMASIYGTYCQTAKLHKPF